MTLLLSFFFFLLAVHHQQKKIKSPHIVNIDDVFFFFLTFCVSWKISVLKKGVYHVSGEQVEHVRVPLGPPQHKVFCWQDYLPLNKWKWKKIKKKKGVFHPHLGFLLCAIYHKVDDKVFFLLFSHEKKKETWQIEKHRHDGFV